MATDDGTPTGVQLEDPMDRFDTPQDIMRKVELEKSRKEQRYLDMLKEATTRKDDISPTQGFALTALAALPMLFANRIKGYGQGSGPQLAAKAALEGVNSYSGALDRNEELAREGKLEQAKNLGGELNSIRSQQATYPGMFLRNQFEEEQRKQAQTDRLAEIEAKAAAERPDPARRATIEKLRDAAYRGELNTPENQKELARLNKDETAEVKGVVDLKGAQQLADIRNENQALKTYSTGRFESITGKPVPKEIDLAASTQDASIVAYEQNAEIFNQARREGNKELARAALSRMGSNLKEYTGAGGALTSIETRTFMAELPKLIEMGDFSEGALQRALGFDPYKLAKAGAQNLRNEFETRLGKQYGLRRIPTTSEVSSSGQPNGQQAGIDKSSAEFKARVDKRVQELAAQQGGQ